MTMLKHLGRFVAAGLLAAALVSAPHAFATDLSLDGNLRLQCGTATAAGNGTAATATLANKCGVITTEALTNPGSSEYTLTLTNSVIAATDIVLFSVSNGTNTTGLASGARVTPTASTGTFVLRQASGTAFNGTLTINYLVVKP